MDETLWDVATQMIRMRRRHIYLVTEAETVSTATITENEVVRLLLWLFNQRATPPVGVRNVCSLVEMAETGSLCPRSGGSPPDPRNGRSHSSHNTF